MSSREYPYLADKVRVVNLTCDLCGQKGNGYKLEWQVDWFRGNDEFQKLCDSCEEKRLAAKKIADKESYRRSRIAAAKEAAFWKTMKQKVETKYEVKYLSAYQWRINGVVDIYIVNRKFHDLRSNKRGDYQDMHTFLARFFKEQ